MSTPYMGEIRVVGFNFPPVGWLTCNGQSLAISQYDALYTLLGTTYGGDGVNTFNVPDLRGRLAPGAQGGQPGPGLSAYPLGAQGGTENVTLTSNQIPAHQHPFSSPIAAANGGTPTNNPAGGYPGKGTASLYAGVATAGATLAAGAVAGTTQPAGGSQPHPNIEPVLALNYIICAEGIYPPQQ